MSETLADEAAIRTLKHRYCYATDAQDEAAFLELFTEDATFDIGVYGTGEGTDDLREFVRWFADLDFEVSAHNAVNPVIEVDGDTATGLWYYVVMYEDPDGTVRVGHGQYDEEYRRVDGEWKISSMVASRRLGTEIPPSK